jgi:hypothetical protein
MTEDSPFRLVTDWFFCSDALATMKVASKADRAVTIAATKGHIRALVHKSAACGMGRSLELE